MPVDVTDNLTGCFRATAARYPQRSAVRYGDQVFTFAQLAETVAAFAGSLADLGVERGQRVAIQFPNCPQFVIAYFAAQHLGATVVPLHCLQGPEEIGYVVADAEAETLIGLNVFGPCLGAVHKSCPGLKNVIVSGETELEGVRSFENLLQATPGPPDPFPASKDDVAVLIYTSGTTGRPKGAMLTHDNLLFDAQACSEVIHFDKDDVFGSVLPFFHSFGATVCMIIPLIAGAEAVLIPKFAPLSVLETLESARCTIFAGVPSMYAVMLQMKSDREFDLSNLRCGVSGGAPLPVEVMLGFEERYGVHMVEGYGPTEASPVVSVNPMDASRKIGSIGLPLPGVECRIVDDELGDVPLGEAGELLVRGRNVMKGYWKDPQRTAETIRDGWLLTGDVATMDEDGFMRIVDRKKDMIIVGGMNVYPREVEDVIYRIDQVAETAVIGVPNRLRGEDVKAFIACKEDGRLGAEAVIEHCKQYLANYKVPRSVEFLPELPRSAIGKILKRVLREQAAIATGNNGATGDV